MSILLHGDCLEELKDIDDNFCDLIFLDLPYGQTSCKWDCLIDLDKLWIELMRVKKLNTPIIFTCTTKFGVSLINSCPKKCPFRYDLVWCKSAPAGFLSAKKMPMRKHEMIYVFYEKLPFYDLSSHKHKFIKERDTEQKNGKIYEGEGNNKKIMEGKYVPPLTTSLIIDGDTYNTKNRKKPITREPADKYDPPLPTSLIKEDNNVTDDCYNMDERHKNGKMKDMRKTTGYHPPLPTSLIKEKMPKCLYGNLPKTEKGTEAHSSQYEPPLPTSLIKEGGSDGSNVEPDLYGYHKNKENHKEYLKNRGFKDCQVLYDPPLPTSLIKEGGSDGSEETMNTIYGEVDIKKLDIERKDRTSAYEPALPHSLLEIKSTRGKHSTEKPVALMEWILKYYSKEGDVVLDATMGSGSMGVACKNMNRNFIGIEKDEEIYCVAVNRIED